MTDQFWNQNPTRLAEGAAITPSARGLVVVLQQPLVLLAELVLGRLLDAPLESLSLPRLLRSCVTMSAFAFFLYDKQHGQIKRSACRFKSGGGRILGARPMCHNAHRSAVAADQKHKWPPIIFERVLLALLGFAEMVTRPIDS